ncbi:MAG: hypothetical protein Q9157_002582 [Trypethelium eluteriae]
MQAPGMTSHKSPSSGLIRPEISRPGNSRIPQSRLPTRGIASTTANGSYPPRSSSQPFRGENSTDNTSITVSRRPVRQNNTMPNLLASKSQSTGHVNGQKPAQSAWKTSSVKPRTPAIQIPREGSMMNADVHTPSLTSGSSISTNDSSRKNTLRRKPSTIDKYAGRGHGEQGSFISSPEVGSIPKSDNPPWEGSILGISMPSASPRSMSPEPLPGAGSESAKVGTGPEVHTSSESRATEVTGAPHTPSIPLCGSPSTRCSESPGLFSHASTPTSMSSYSPGVLSSKFVPRARTISPAQQSGLPFVRRKMAPDQSSTVTETQRLSAVQETSASSSSIATERAQEPTKEVGKQDARQRTKDRPNFQAPPELAHLLNDPPPLKGSSKPERPVRPSRDGTPTLGSREPSPIVQSNLSPFFNSYHKRQSSSENKIVTSPSNESSNSISSSKNDVRRARLQKPANFSSRNPSPATIPHSRSTTPLNVPINPSVVASSDAQTTRSSSESQEAIATSAADNHNKVSRFGFFSRRAKGDNAAALERPKREARKGPMAGTGHEGYGRRPLRGRRVSSSSTDSIGRSPSADSAAGSVGGSMSNRKSSFGSNSGDTPMDEFLSERLTPVFLRGEGGSIKSDRTSWDFVSSTSNPSTTQLSEGDSRRSSEEKPSLPPKSKMRPFRSPSPLKGRLLGQQPPEPASNGHTNPVSVKVVNKSKIDEGKTASKAVKRWNFFQRTHNSSKKEQVVPKPTQDARQHLDHFGPHYAMINNEERLDMEDLDRMMQDGEGYSSVEETDYNPLQSGPPVGILSNPTVPFGEVDRRNAETSVDDAASLRAGRRQVHSILLPSPPTLDRPFAAQDRLMKIDLHPQREGASPTSKGSTVLKDVSKVIQEPSSPSKPILKTSVPPSTPLYSPQESPSDSPGRPSRLAQVGRIPQVVSKRDRDRKLPTQSFSRPFVNNQPRPNVSNKAHADPVNSSTSPIKARRESRADKGSPGKSDSGKEAVGRSQAIAAATSICTADVTKPPEFFSFPPRQNSELSYTSSSGTGSFPGQPWVFSPQTTAASASEEVWNEYDDLIDDVLSPVDEPCSAKSALGAPFQYQTALSPKSGASKDACVEQGKAIADNEADTDAFADPIRRSSTAPLTISHLRQQRSSFLSALHSDGTRESGFTELIKGYAERNVSVSSERKKDRLSLPPSTRCSSTGTRFSLSPTAQSPVSSSHSLSATATEFSLPAPTTTKPVKRESEDRMEEANLRFGALMTSKWLSFGRVLFSPAHSEIKDGKNNRVLIVDGLGKDWSYYCALTYPKATVYNLGSTPTSSQTNPRSSWQSLPNHRHIHHASISHPYPFPRGFFAVVIFRFPIGASEATYRAALSECKRVLRPGGHLELSVLDIDMVNMGSRARRAVRQLKMKMQAAQRDVCLKPKSDSMIRLLGMRGYESINRCMVGVPAAGILGTPVSSPASSENGDKSASTCGSDKAKQVPTDRTSAGKGAQAKGESRKSNASFGDIFKSNADTKDSGVGIAKMVARVGRWWWSSCYETPFLSDGDASKSIWDDPAFLRECEELGTSFKLLICYAQKPNMAVRRTVSV